MEDYCAKRPLLLPWQTNAMLHHTGKIKGCSTNCLPASLVKLRHKLGVQTQQAMVSLT